MICPACGETNPEGKRFCGKCGAPLLQLCPECGTSNPPSNRFCGDCGHSLAADGRPAPRGLVEGAESGKPPPIEAPGPVIQQAFIQEAYRGQAPPSHPERVEEPTSFCDGRYEVRRFLGEGGKKLVYLAHDAKLDRDVAFALIKTDGLDAEGLLRIKREAQAMGRLGDHPHIVSVYDIGEVNSPSGGAPSVPPAFAAAGAGGQPYLVSQLMGGGDVEGLIEKAEGHRVPLDVALKIADEVCQALEHAHSHGIVHRDLKPGNVWLTADGIAKLGDFGLAVALDKVRLT